MSLHINKPNASTRSLKYPHTNGKLDGLVTEIYVARDWIRPTDEIGSQHILTEKGLHHLTELGIDLLPLEKDRDQVKAD